MNLSSVAVVICVFVSAIGANNLELTLQNNGGNQTIFKRYSLRADYGDYGLRVGKSMKNDALEIGIFHSEGREKKNDYQMISILLGYKVSTLMTLIMTILGGVALKAVGLAKLALITSAVVFIQKLFHQPHEQYYHEQRTPEIVEIDPLPEHSVPEASFAGGDYQPSSIGNFYSYDSYTPTATGSTANQETTVLAPSNSSSSNGSQQQISAAKRRDVSKHKQIIPLITVHRYTVKSN